MKKKTVKTSKIAKRPSLQELSESDLAKASGGSVYMEVSSGDPNKEGDCSRTCSGWTWTPFVG